MKIPFIGRQQELHYLNKLLLKNSASLVTVQGRRRIGKSCLIKEFIKPLRSYTFMGLSPVEAATAQDQRNEFSRQFKDFFGFEVHSEDWGDLFTQLAKQCAEGRVVIVLDEISWMATGDPLFLGKLKTIWDLYFSDNAQLILILCGSASYWIEKNILSSTGFMGRISYRLTVGELPLKDCNQFWLKMRNHVSAYEKFKVLAVTGGIPRYLEEIKPTLSAEENIKDLCFIKGGTLVNEFNDIFSDLFSNRAAIYKKIIQSLSDGPKQIKDICEHLNIKTIGLMGEYLADLLKSGFISRDYTWNIASCQMSRLSIFRLSDNYLRFYLNYIDKNRSRIENNEYAFKSFTALPGFEGMMGLQFENLVLNNRRYIRECLHIVPEEVIFDNSFFQKKTTRHPGCQIDYLIQTKFGGLYLCEIKFSKHPITIDIIAEVQKKLDHLYYPKGFSCRPVLIHVNGVHEEVMDSGFFSNIIDFGSILVG